MITEEALARVSFLSGASEAQRARLARRCGLRQLDRDESLWEVGAPCDEISVCVEGRFKLISCSKRSTILDVCGPGQLLCEQGLSGSQSHYCCRAVAMDDGSVALSLPRAALWEAIEETPSLATPLLRALGERGVLMCRRLAEVAPGRVERRIALLLTRLAEGVGRPKGPGVLIPMPLSRQELASLCGTSVETATRVMTRLERADVVATFRGGFFAPDRAALERLTRGPLAWWQRRRDTTDN